MKNTQENTLTQTIGLGVIAGMRATFAPAIVSHFFSEKRNTSLSKSKLGFIQSPAAAVVTKILAAAEITGDKLPDTPGRIVAPQVIARAASGAFTGAVLFASNKDRILKGIVIGGVTGFVATYGTYFMRKYVSQSTFIKEPATGALEDVVAIAVGVLLMK